MYFKKICLALITLLVLFTSCATVHDRLFTGTLIRDCSGTYIRINEKGDFLVCNSKLLETKQEGEQVTVVYDFTKDCPENEGKMVCTLFHENKGTIRIKSLQ